MTNIFILLNGTYLPLLSPDDKVEETLKFIDEAIHESTKNPHHFVKFSRGTFLLSKNIIGYYTTKVVETSQEKAVKIIEKQTEMLEKQIKESSEGDDWKA